VVGYCSRKVVVRSDTENPSPRVDERNRDAANCFHAGFYELSTNLLEILYARCLNMTECEVQCRVGKTLYHRPWREWRGLSAVL
jgi:ferredoxin-like protein FixX